MYCRRLTNKNSAGLQNENKVEVVLDIQDDLVKSGFVLQKDMRMTVVDKIKMNNDHSLIGFTVDIGNTESLTGGIKCMNTNKVLKDIRIDKIGSLEFSYDGKNIFYT